MSFLLQCKKKWWIRDLKQPPPDVDQNGDAKKATSLITKTTTLHVHQAFLYISLPSPHDNNVKLLFNVTNYKGRKNSTTNFSFFYWFFMSSLQIQLKQNPTTINFKWARTYFMNDIPIAIAVLVALTPYFLLNATAQQLFNNLVIFSRSVDPPK